MPEILSFNSYRILITGLLLSFGFAVIYIMNNKRRREYIPAAKVSKLIIYPIKSITGIEVRNAFVTKSGLKYGLFRDRCWMLVNSDLRCITQRRESTLALIKPSIINDSELLLNAPNMPDLRIRLKLDRNPNDVIIKTKIWGTFIEGIDCGQEAENWFSLFLSKPGTKLIQHTLDLNFRPSNIESKQKIEETKKYPIGYQDGSPLLLINNDSVNELNTRISTENQVSYRNFRPNILISECDPYGEDKWKFVSINNLEFINLKPCDRCVLTTVNPDTGIRTNMEPLDTLRTFRLSEKLYGKAPLFGINLGPENEGEICVGDVISAVI